MMRKKAFTIIELLVVIAVIGLLASIILVRVQGARVKARVASALNFSHSIQNGLGAGAVGIWDFDEVSSTIVRDRSGYGNDGIINGASPTSDTPHGVVALGKGKYALDFNGTSDYIDCGNHESLDITDKITIEVWIKPSSAQEICGTAPGNSGVAAKAETGIPGNVWSWQLRYGSYSPDCHLGFQFNEAGASSVWATVKQKLRVGEWYHVAGTFDGTNVKCYLNGELKDTNPMSAIDSSNAKLLIGDEGWGNNFGGIIDEVRIYHEALIIGEIQKHYVEGKENN